MKKLISMTLAVIMVLSAAVIAYAGTIVLEPVIPEVEEIVELPSLVLDEEYTSVFAAGKGGTYYIMLDPTVEYKDVKVTGNGCVKASLFKYDPEKHMPIDGISYCVVKYSTDEVVTEALGYFEAKEKAKELCDAEKTTQYVVRPYNCYINIVEIVVEDNYTSQYKIGNVKIEGKLGETYVSAAIEVISDVFYYDVENVKYAAKNEKVLDTFYNGISSYDEKVAGIPTVVTKRAFRNIVDENLTLENNGVEILIKDIVESQPSVNFSAFIKVKEKEENKDAILEFGFYGAEQKIYSDFVITPELDFTYFTLREFFGEKLEEDNVVTYQILKDGKYFGEFTVDYATVKQNEKIELEIVGEAGDNLGCYSIVVAEDTEATDSEEEVYEEENPNTGAPSFLEWLWMLIFS